MNSRVYTKSSVVSPILRRMAGITSPIFSLLLVPKIERSNLFMASYGLGGTRTQLTIGRVSSSNHARASVPG